MVVRTEIVEDYLENLRACLTFGRCAGKVTELTKLHQNRLMSIDIQARQLLEFIRICRIVRDANYTPNGGVYVQDVQEILYDILTGFDEIDDDVLHPFWYLDWFNEKDGFFYNDEEGKIIYPSISQEDRTNFEETITKWFNDGLGDNITKENLSIIEHSANLIVKQVFDSIAQLDQEKWQERIERTAELQDEKEALSAKLDEDYKKLNDYQKWMGEFPIELDDRERQILDRKEIEIKKRIESTKNWISKIDNHIMELERRQLEVSEKLKNQLPSPNKQLVELCKSTDNRIFSDIDHLIQSIKTGDCNIDIELDRIEKGGLISIFGDPGWGKTVQLRQFAHQFTSKQLEKDSNLRIPIFVKAKTLPNIIRELPDIAQIDKEFMLQRRKVIDKMTANVMGMKEDSEELTSIEKDMLKGISEEEIVRKRRDQPFNPFALNAPEVRQRRRAERRGKPFNPFASSKDLTPKQSHGIGYKYMKLSFLEDAMVESESELDSELVSNLFSEKDLKWDDIVLIIDAYDEVIDEPDRLLIMEFLSNSIALGDCKIIISCRDSHKTELVDHLKHKDSNPLHIPTKIDFTPDELRYIMPTKLANAWGINSDQLSHSATVQFDDYEAVLTHPLFVGFFCMLLEADALTPLTETKSQINVDGPISLQHVIFLRKVIEFGLEPTIKERSSISTPEIEQIKEVFFYIASTYLTTGLTNMRHILFFIKKYHGIVLDDKEKKILNEQLGVMFVNSEKEIEWTHKTLPEVAAGLLIKDDENYKQFLTKNYGSVFGKQGSFWSECLLMTLIQDDLEQIDSTRPFLSLRKLFPTMGKTALNRTLNMFGVEDKNYIANIRKEGDWYRFNSTGNEGVKPLMEALGETFFDSLRSGKPFPIPNELIGTPKGDLLIDFFRRTNLVGEPYADIVFKPEELSLPNLPLVEIFDRLEDDIEKLCLFYLIRKAKSKGGTIVHPNKSLERAFVHELMLRIKSQKTSFEFNFDQHSKWLSMILGCLKSKNSTQLMQLICGRMKNSISSIDVNEIDDDSLEILNSTILKKIRTMGGPNQNYRNKITADYLRSQEPQILQQLIGCILSFGLRTKGYFEESPYEIPNEFEDLFATIKVSWGLPDNRYAHFSLAFTSEPKQLTLFGMNVAGDIEKIPTWIPISEFVINQRQQGEFNFKKKFTKK
ncbi:MAG: hypothetical protein ACPHUK_06480 [Candidatus Poseidoniaceae archaeon]